MPDVEVEVELPALDSPARVAASQGRPAAARELLAAADEVLPAVRHLVVDSDRIDRDRTLALR